MQVALAHRMRACEKAAALPLCAWAPYSAPLTLHMYTRRRTAAGACAAVPRAVSEPWQGVQGEAGGALVPSLLLPFRLMCA